MKEKMLQVKDYVIAHKKQIIIGVGAAIATIVGTRVVTAILKNNEDETVEIVSGTIEEITENKEA